MNNKKNTQHISFIIHDDTLYRGARFLGFSTPESLSLQALGGVLKKRLTLSLLTTMPRTLKVYGDSMLTYEEWMCDRLNRDRRRPLVKPGVSDLFYIETKATEMLRRDGSKRKPGEVYQTYIENFHAAMSHVSVEHGVTTRDQWMSNRFGFGDAGVCDLRVISNKTQAKTVTVVLYLDSKKNLTPYVNNVRQWLSEFKSDCSVVYIPPQD